MFNETSRRDFLKTAAGSLLVVFTQEDVAKSSTQELAAVSPAVKLGVIGIGQRGKEILSSLSRLASAQVVAICDSYEPALKRGQEIAPRASLIGDYRKLLESSDIEAVVISTPSHQHKEIALACIQAGKHVYCEAPLAGTSEDAKTIALAAQQSPKLKFQTGLQGRSNALYNHVSKFVKSGALGTAVQVNAQWNKKQSWRRMAPTPERESDLNWRLSSKTSSGLIGEIGIHQIDLAIWFLKSLPTSAAGVGAIVNWKDDRDVADTVQCIIEFPNNVRMIYSSTLASSFSDSFTLFQGNNSSLMMREKQGWMIKEADSPLLGWEVYARKEQVHNETGIAMVADATKILEAGKEPGKESAREPTRDELTQALDDFVRSVRSDSKVSCGPIEGYQATVAAIKANEAIAAGSKIVFEKSMFELK
ncbi:MAG TPA: Gfo/Idh/MocA family oxidoreductase [Pyrinomonadaceae bacterium]|nr:Gfo/Idh/MocA family oxidoreductase [Pyrinomonadaceae bacterium]